MSEVPLYLGGVFLLVERRVGGGEAASNVITRLVQGLGGLTLAQNKVSFRHYPGGVLLLVGGVGGGEARCQGGEHLQAMVQAQVSAKSDNVAFGHLFPHSSQSCRLALGLRVWGLGCRVWGLGFRVWGPGLRIWGFSVRFRVQG